MLISSKLQVTHTLHDKTESIFKLIGLNNMQFQA